MNKIITLIIFSVSFHAQAKIKVPPRTSQELWEAVELMEKDVDQRLIRAQEKEETLELEAIECVFEMYDACSFFSEVHGERRLLVALGGAIELANALERAGVALDPEVPRIEARKLSCVKTSSFIGCDIVE